MPKDMHGVMKEFSEGKLHSGSPTGKIVRNRKQAIAIGLSEQRQMGQRVTHADVKKYQGMKRRGKK